MTGLPCKDLLTVSTKIFVDSVGTVNNSYSDHDYVDGFPEQ